MQILTRFIIIIGAVSERARYPSELNKEEKKNTVNERFSINIHAIYFCLSLSTRISLYRTTFHDEYHVHTSNVISALSEL